MNSTHSDVQSSWRNPGRTHKKSRKNTYINILYIYISQTNQKSGGNKIQTYSNINHLAGNKILPRFGCDFALRKSGRKNRHLHMGWALTLHGAWNTLDCSLRKVHVFFRASTSIADRMIYVAFWRHRWHVIQCMCVIADMWFIVWYM